MASNGNCVKTKSQSLESIVKDMTGTSGNLIHKVDR